MKRREFINAGLLTTLTGALATPTLLSSCKTDQTKSKGKAKNIIFMVADGMSIGTPTMADLLSQRKDGKGSTWMDLYRNNRAKLAMVDTASADSLVTDSAAGASAWGGGVRVKNGKLNMSTTGEKYKPILQKFKDAGKAVGCVTTVPITHATPAGFSVCMKHRNLQDQIASKYLDLRFDVMMGGGMEYFDGRKREDKKDILPDFKAQKFNVVHTRKDMKALTPGKPTLGIFSDGGLPYTLDQMADKELTNNIPSLAEMTEKSIALMQGNSEGFLLQVEGGKVDWAAHANDASALLYEQLAFDKAVAVAIDFAQDRDDTLVIITTDHGNANPGLIKCDKLNQKFDTLQNVKHTNDWILNSIEHTDSPARVIERINYAQGITITDEEAKTILKAYNAPKNGGLYNAYNLPFKQYAEILHNYISVYWSGMNHSADFVELAMFGVETEALKPLIKNTDLHNYMLTAAGIPTRA